MRGIQEKFLDIVIFVSEIFHVINRRGDYKVILVYKIIDGNYWVTALF